MRHEILGRAGLLFFPGVFGLIGCAGMAARGNDSGGEFLAPASENLSLPFPFAALPSATETGLFPGISPVGRQKNQLPEMFSPVSRRRHLTPYPWKTSIQTTVFWIGEKPAPGNPVSNFASCWDTSWNKSFGGYDDPSPAGRAGYRPREFIPRQNPFYIALPYNDTVGNQTKDSARQLIPWFRDSFYREGRSVLKGRWVAIRRADRICYAQWEDCGPFETDDGAYVFGGQLPRTAGNGGAGLDVSPAVRDFLGFRYSTVCDWRFVDLPEIPEGPWKQWGRNNPFARRNPKSGTLSTSEGITKLYELRDQYLAHRPSRPVVLAPPSAP